MIKHPQQFYRAMQSSVLQVVHVAQWSCGVMVVPGDIVSRVMYARLENLSHSSGMFPGIGVLLLADTCLANMLSFLSV